MNIPRILPLAAACIAVCACFCAHDDNPFIDPSNARAVVSSASFADKDTITIFATETLQIMIAVCDLVDSAMVVACNNRLEPDTMIFHHPSVAGPNTCLISFADTGWATVIVSTFRKNGDKTSTEYSLYCRNPLSQPDIRGEYGARIPLLAGKVSDKDVVYHWDFGNGNTFSAPVPDTSAIVKFAAYDTVGSLWVSDADGSHPSPKIRFSYYLKDNAGPKIVCVNPSYSNKDTILTGDTTFYLRLRISDSAQSLPVFSAQVNGDTFRIKEDPYYIQIFSHMDTAAQFIPVVVSAVDNQHFRNISRDTFFIRFSDTLSHSNGLVITMKDPSTDSSVSRVIDKGILGQLEDYSHDSVTAVVKMWLNDVPKLPPETVLVTLAVPGTFNFLCSLSVGVNRIRLVAYSMNGDSLDAKTFRIAYDPSFKDTTSPVILEITADGRGVEHFYSPRDSAFVKIIAFDEASGMKAVQVNGKTIPPSPDGHGFIWYDTVTLVHTVAGTTFTVSAMDNDSNATKKTFTLYKNSAPVITHTPSFPGKVYVGSTYRDNLICQDNDNDPVIVSKVSGPSSVSVSQNGSITWKPLAADTGEQTVALSLFDGYEYGAFSFHAAVIGDTANMPPQVRFANAQNVFPAFLEVNHDSLKMTLKTSNDSGNAPLSFSAIVSSGPRTPGGAIVMQNRVLSWRPVPADTGLQTIVLTVTDRFRRSDTLRSDIAIVPPNRPCSLYVSSAIPTFNDGELNLSNATMPETLFFSVHDPDPAVAEQLVARIQWPTNESVIGIDSSRRFILVLDPKNSAAKSKDTVQVIVRDRSGHADSLTFFISYVPVTLAVLNSRTLVINTSSGGAQITQNVLNFPLLVRLDKSFFPFDSAPNRGRDVRFRKSDGTQRPYEIETWDSAAGTAAIWVLMDTVFANSATQNVQMSWRSTTERGGSDGHAVFDTAKGFLGVWHMSDGASGVNANSSQSNFSGMPAPAANPLLPSTGVIANADSFGGSNYVSVGNLQSRQKLTVSAWVNPVSYDQFSKIMVKGLSTYVGPYVNFVLEPTNAPPSPVRFKIAFSANDTVSAPSTSPLPLNSWTYLVGTYDGTTVRLFVNGGLASSRVHKGGNASLPVNNQPVSIGGWNLQPNESFIGSIDEARISRQVWTADFITLSYETQRAGSTMVTFR